MELNGMSKKETNPKPTSRKRKENYDEKLKIKGSLLDVLKVAVTPKSDENEKADKWRFIHRPSGYLACANWYIIPIRL